MYTIMLPFSFFQTSHPRIGTNFHGFRRQYNIIHYNTPMPIRKRLPLYMLSVILKQIIYVPITYIYKRSICDLLSL